MGFAVPLFVVLFKFFFWIGFSIGKLIGWLFAILFGLLTILVMEALCPLLKWIFNKGRNFILNQIERRRKPNVWQ